MYDRGCFSRIRLRYFSFKRENKGLFLVLNAVYCWFLWNSYGKWHYENEDNWLSKEMFLDIEKHTMCVIHFALEVEFTVSLFTLGYFVLDSGI